MHRSTFVKALVATLLIVSSSVSAQLAERKTLTLEGVKNILEAAEAEARGNDWNVVIAVVDEGGHLLGLVRLDDTQTASIDIAIGKARAAAAFRRPSGAFEEALANRPGLLTVAAGLVLLEGGLPVIVDGQTIGAVGVSGVRSDQDEQIAAAGIAALQE